MNRIVVFQRFLAAGLGLAMGANGIAMLVAGSAWYAAVPGVTETGPFNAHFVKDIGAAYLTSSAGLLWWAWRGSTLARGVAIAGTAFLGLHGLIHLAAAVGDSDGLGHLARDFPGVVAPPLLAIAAVWPTSSPKETPDAQGAA